MLTGPIVAQREGDPAVRSCGRATIRRVTEPAEILDQPWDAIVVGTGIGGATLGHALAQHGWRVLFCERGASSARDGEGRGDYPETAFGGGTSAEERLARLARAGRWSADIEDRSRADRRGFVPFLGAGTGGSSAIYGMAMERLFPSDFSPRRHFPDAGDSTLPETWPIGYEELAPHYVAAERLYRLRGGPDPLRGADGERALRDPPPLTGQGRELAQRLASKGLHPYRVPMACEFVPGCRCCQGYLCPESCKNDGERICLQPAIQTGRAQLIDECEVVRLDASRRNVREVICNWKGRRIGLRARVIVLAAGALATPGILLASASAEWPGGLANVSGLVGRNLMRHFNDLYALFPRSVGAATDNRRKEIAFNDFYESQGAKLGTVQSFGRLPPAEMLLQSMREDLLLGPAAWAAPLFAMLRPALRPLLRRIVARSAVLATIVEDPPYADNRVTLAGESPTSRQAGLAIEYRIRPAEQARIRRMRELMRDALKPMRYLPIRQAENNRMLAHACGTCRFGADPADSVLDRNNRAHGLDNLYVVDSSFFPSSGGTNPSLTIAANALRVAEHLRGASGGSAVVADGEAPIRAA